MGARGIRGPLERASWSGLEGRRRSGPTSSLRLRLWSATTVKKAGAARLARWLGGPPARAGAVPGRDSPARTAGPGGLVARARRRHPARSRLRPEADSETATGGQGLRDLQCAARGAANRVVAEHDEPPTEDRTRADAADGCCHPNPGVAVQTGLGPIGRVRDHEGGRTARPVLGGECGPGADEFLCVPRWTAEPDRDRSRVPIGDGNTEALGADLERRRLDGALPTGRRSSRVPEASPPPRMSGTTLSMRSMLDTPGRRRRKRRVVTSTASTQCDGPGQGEARPIVEQFGLQTIAARVALLGVESAGDHR